MKIIERNYYLDQLESVRGTPDIKVITGVRRSGKSKLMSSFINQIVSKEKNANIIHINFNLNKFSNILTKEKMIKYVESKFVSGKNNYLFIDEVQRCKGFEEAINGFHAEEKYDIYITGSNAFLMGNDLATLFTGRTYDIEVFPFSFKEFVKYYEIKNQYEGFQKYLKEGGMSGSYVYEERQQKYKYISEIYNTLILRDIVQKHKVRNPEMLERLSDYLIDNISNQSSLRNISDNLGKGSEPTTHRTVGKQINYLCDSFAFYKIKRFDLKGKKYLTTNEKYYLSDHAFKFAKHGTRNPDFGRILENIVAIELLRRGYEVYTGFLYDKEIDFVAIQQEKKMFIQVSNTIEDEETRKRELSPLISIKESYPKIVITRTGYEPYDIDGIQIIDIADWLLK